MMMQERLRQAEGGGETVWQAPHNFQRRASPSRSPAEGSEPQCGQRARNALLEARALPKGDSRRPQNQLRPYTP